MVAVQFTFCAAATDRSLPVQHQETAMAASVANTTASVLRTQWSIADLVVSMARAVVMEGALDVSEFQIKLRSRSESTFEWMDLLSPAIEQLEPELEVIIDQAWNLHGYCEKDHIYVSICL
eukprot:6236956-Amphidinium_carterae.1